MANRQNGEVSATGASGKQYTLKTSFKGMCAVEEMFDKNFDEVVAISDAGSRRHLRALIWSMFQQHHPEIAIEDIDTVIDDCGGMAEMSKKVVQAARAALPDKRDLDDLGVKPPPPAAQVEPKKRSTGAGSTSKPSASA